MTRVIRTEKFPRRGPGDENSLIIYDRVLLKASGFRSWLKRYPRSYPVKSGESLKDLRRFPAHIEKIARLTADIPNRRLKIIAVGGGSVGDFAGFVASVYKRGVPLIQIPSTWLAAIDSAHGGKNGLNVGGAKNQIGSIRPADQIFLIRDLLFTQPRERETDAAGELLKIALLSGRKSLWPGRRRRLFGAKVLWNLLPAAIEEKMRIVRRDPLEKKGLRQLLNLGHTVGHVLEASAGLSHGVAVGQGLVFAVAFSRARGICGAAAYERLISHPLWTPFAPSPTSAKALAKALPSARKLLSQDKKRDRSGSVRFVFLKDVGRPVILETNLDDVVSEMKRQKDRLRDLYG